MENFDVVIVGGGASSLVCANLLKDFCSVAIIERNDRIGKKILVTGNGRCNLSNINLNDSFYNVDISPFLEKFGFDKTMYFYGELGLLTHMDEQGRVYPFSNTANSVLDVLRYGIENKCKIFTSCEVTEICNENSTFKIITEGNCFCANYCIVSTGGNTSINLFKKIHPQYNKCVPSLCGLKTTTNKGLNGVRVDNVVAKIEGTDIEQEGEILFKENAISGILIFNLSSFLARTRNFNSVISIDFMPKISQDELVEILSKRKFDNILMGIFHSALAKNIMEKANCQHKNLTKTDIVNIAKIIKNYKIITFAPMDNNQIYSGGVPLSSVDENLMSKTTQNLFFTGECLDVDGVCGGYNLQWATTSAMAVAEKILYDK